MKLNSTDLRKFYMGAVSLYGILYDEDAIDILKTYFKDFDEKSLLKDMESRSEKMTREYSIWPYEAGKKEGYMIVDEFFGSEDIRDLEIEQDGKKRYVPEDFKSFCAYGLNRTLKTSFVARDRLYATICKYMPKSLSKYHLDYVVKEILLTLSFGDADIGEAMELMERFGFNIKSDNDVQDVVDAIMFAYNNTKKIENLGFSPAEML